MRNLEKELTPAQIALLDCCTTNGADCLYKSLSITLGLSIISHVPESIGGDAPTPTVKTLEAWYFTLELLEHLHDISAESPGTAG